MPSLYELKPRFQTLLHPLAGKLAALGVTANQVTIAAVAASAAYGTAMLLTGGSSLLLSLLPVFLFLRMALNTLDGMIARAAQQMSPTGFVLNELGDVIADAALYLPLALTPGLSASLVVTVVVLGLASEFAGTLALALHQPRNYAGPFGKSDRAAFFGLVALGLGTGVAPAAWLNIALAVAVVLAALTVANRARAPLAA